VARIKKHHNPVCTGGNCDCPYRLDYRPLGLRGPRKRLFFPTKKAAEKHLAETSTKVSRGEYLDSTKVPTFVDAAQRWYTSKTDRRPAYVADLRSRLDKHILPRIGETRLDRITVGAIEKLRDHLRVEGFSPLTVNAVLQMVGAVFKAAVRRGECTANPVDRVERAFMAAKELKPNDPEDDGSDGCAVNPDAILSPGEIAHMIDNAAPGLYRTLFSILAKTGLRSGEAFALSWSDVELTDAGPGRLCVRKTLTWARPKGEEMRPRFYPPKTKAGLRTVKLTPTLVAELKRWKLQCPPNEYDLVFPTVDGKPIRRSNALRTGLWQALRRAGLRRVNMHSLRHSFASAMLVNGAPITEVQATLGHANPSITLRVYSHYIPSGDTGTVDRVANAIEAARADTLTRVILPDVKRRAETDGKWALSGHSTSPENAANGVSS
jgi:integrase